MKITITNDGIHKIKVITRVGTDGGDADAASGLNETCVEPGQSVAFAAEQIVKFVEMTPAAEAPDTPDMTYRS